jgi:hypothetical protein
MRLIRRTVRKKYANIITLKRRTGAHERFANHPLGSLEQTHSMHHRRNHVAPPCERPSQIATFKIIKTQPLCQPGGNQHPRLTFI